MAAQGAPNDYGTWSCRQLEAESDRIDVQLDLLRKAQITSPKGTGTGEMSPDPTRAMVNRDSLESRIARFEQQREAIRRAMAENGCR